MDFRNKIDLFMKENSIENLKQLANESNIPYTTLRDCYEKNNAGNSRVGTIKKLAKYMNCTIDYLDDESIIDPQAPLSHLNTIEDFRKENTISDEELERRLKDLNEKEGVKILFDKKGELTEEELNQIVAHAMFIKEQHYKNKNS